MGRMSIYEKFEDFIMEAKRIPLKEIYYNITPQTIDVDAVLGGVPIKAKQHISTIKLTACEDGKRYIVFNQKAGELIAHSKTTSDEIEAFSASIRAAVDEMVKQVQKEYPSATLIYGTTMPYQG